MDKSQAQASDSQPDRRREERFLIGAAAVLRLAGGAEAYPAITLNISAGGLLLKLTEPVPFQVDDQIECEIALPEDPKRAFASWGAGRVVRVDRLNAAVELRSGVFTSADLG